MIPLPPLKPTLGSSPTLDRAFRLAAVATAIAYFVYFSLFTCAFHDMFATYAYDLGTFDQGIWLAGHSREQFVTVRGLPLLGDHVRLVSFLLAPIYFVWDDVRALLVLQTLSISSAGWLIFEITRLILPSKPWWALVFCVSYLLNPAVQNLNLDHAHPEAFAATFVLAAVYALRLRKTVPFWIAAVLAMSCKEDVPLLFIALGLGLLCFTATRRLGAALTSISGLYFAFCMLVVLPYFNGYGFFRLTHGGYFFGLATHVDDPAWALQHVLQTDRLEYILKLGLPNLLLFLLAPFSLLPAVPSLLANLVSDVSYTRNLRLHYQALIVPFLYVATADAIIKLLRSLRPTERQYGILFESLACTALVAASLMANSYWSRIPLRNFDQLWSVWRQLGTSEEVIKAHLLLGRIPPTAAVTADYTLVPHLSHRPQIYMYPNPFVTKDWAITGENPHDPSAVEYVIVRSASGSGLDVLDKLLTEERIELIAGDREVGLYRRVPESAPDPQSSCGDWTGDGRLNDLDVKRIAAAALRGTSCPMSVCDVDGDQQFTTRDAAVLRVSILEGRTSLPCR